MTQAVPSGAEGTSRVAGVVLCQVGEHRLAFPASQVVSIEAFIEGAQSFPQARIAFAMPGAPTGRAMRAESGEAVVVDSVEVQQDTFPLMLPPALMVGAIGGSLRGFASIGQKLWPVLELVTFSRFIAAAEVPSR